MQSFLDELSAPQREAAEQTEGPLLIVAGAGAGKTKTITYRIFNLITKGVAPQNILAVTFTNKAAKEMGERVTKLLERDRGTRLDAAAGPFTPFETAPASGELFRTGFIGTFHALGATILREKGHVMGIDRHFTIKDSQDSLSLIKEAIALEGIDPKRYEPKRFQHVISQQKNALVTPEVYGSRSGEEHFFSMAARVWMRYENLLAKDRSLDFDDLIGKPITLLEKHPEVRAQYLARWQYVHIDEYQDTNDAQHAFSKLLVGPAMNICAVGDTDQNIYSWRGANVKNMLRFEKDFPGTKIVMLEENYRSTATILHAANEIIKNNTLRHEKKLFTKKSEGEKISLANAYNERFEADFIARTVAQLLKTAVKPTDIAVLYRANFQSRALEEAFLSRDLPYQVLGTRFFERKEIKDILSYVRAAMNPESLADIKRVINVPARGIGKVTLVKLFAGQKDALPPAMRARIDDFYKLLAAIREHALSTRPTELVKFVLQRSGLETELHTQGEEGKERLENIRELVSLAVRYDGYEPEEGVEKFLSDAALASDQDELMNKSTGVRLMTVHASKGLEFPYVFITGLEHGLFPHDPEEVSRSKSGENKLEEERRLLYVAMTRAEKKLYLSFADTRTIFGTTRVNLPSQFLSEIPDHILQLEQVDPDYDPTTRPKTIYFD